jgi:DNA-binding MarR family transcriptional regulator
MTEDKNMTGSPDLALGPGGTAAEVPDAEADLIDLADDVRVAVTRATRRIRQERSSDEITDGQYSVLATLSNHGPKSPSALAEDQKVQPPHMTRVLNALVAAGLVRRDEHPTDGRQVVISITEAGEVEVHETRRRRNEWLAARLATYTPDERAVLAEAATLLRRLAAQ